jgi:hypothetical protein
MLVPHKSVKAQTHLFFGATASFPPFGLFYRIAAQMGETSAPSMRLLNVIGRYDETDREKSRARKLGRAGGKGKRIKHSRGC